MQQHSPERHIFTVSELSRDVRTLLEQAFPLIWLEGEISNLARPASGHWYLSLKDSKAQIRCAMFRQRNRLLDFTPEDGMHVLARGRLSLYEPRGDFQFIIEHLEPAGDGALQRAFEQLKQKLDHEGLFDSAHKQALPRWPKRIGIITSPSGAAIRDILSTLKRRFPACPVLIYPAAVQGEQAADELVRALQRADARQECDVLILARGGGSLEDLWPFNEERLARAIHACRIPVVSGIGHEIDFTIADFVADQRAPTPTAAAELVSQDQTHLLRQFLNYRQRLSRAMRNSLRQQENRFRALCSRLRHPRQRLEAQIQRLDELDQRLQRALRHRLENRRHHLARHRARLQQHSPQQRLQRLRERLHFLHHRLNEQQRHRQHHLRQQLTALGQRLHTVSPLATLERGYAIVTRSDNGQLVRHSQQLQPGQQVDARLAHGRIRCNVEDILE